MCGYDQALVRYYYQTSRTNERINLLFSLIRIPIVLSVVLGSILGLMVSVQIFTTITFKTTLLFILNVIFLIIFRFVALTLRLEMQTFKYSVLNILHKAFYLLFCVYMIMFTQINEFIVITFSIVASLFLSTSWGIYAQRGLWNFFMRDKGFTCNLKDITLYSLPFTFSSMLSWGFEAADKLSIKYWGTYADVGIYTGATAIVGFISIIATIFTTVWIPIAMENYVKTPSNKSLYTNVNAWITVVMYFIAISIILSKDIIIKMLGSQYSPAADLIPYLIFAPIMTAVSETTVNGINFKEKTHYHILITFIAMIANVIGNVSLVPVYGPTGAAISTGVSYIIFWAMRTGISLKLYYVNYNVKQFILLTLAVYIYAIYISMQRNSLSTVIGYIICCCIIWVLYHQYIVKGIRIIYCTIRGENK